MTATPSASPRANVNRGRRRPDPCMPTSASPCFRTCLNDRLAGAVAAICVRSVLILLPHVSAAATAIFASMRSYLAGSFSGKVSVSP